MDAKWLLLQENLINLKIFDDNAVFEIKVRPDAPLRRLMNAFFDKKVSLKKPLWGRHPLCPIWEIFSLTLQGKNNYRFIFDGRRIQETDTPAAFNMADGDIIDAYVITNPEPAETAPATVLLKVVLGETTTNFRCERDQPLGTLMDAFSNNKGLENARFLFKDLTIQPHSTPESLQMLDTEEIIVQPVPVRSHWCN